MQDAWARGLHLDVVNPQDNEQCSNEGKMVSLSVLRATLHRLEVEVTLRAEQE